MRSPPPYYSAVPEMGPSGIPPAAMPRSPFDSMPRNAPGGGGSGITHLQIIAIARAYWRQALIIWLVPTVALAAALWAMPKAYMATATLVVDDSSGSTLSAQAPPPDQLATYLAEQDELLTSPEMLRPVVQRLGLASTAEWAGNFRGDPEAATDLVASKLSKALTIEISPNDQLLYVAASAATPAEAANIANAVVAQYFAEGRSRAQRYEDQLDRKSVV